MSCNERIAQYLRKPFVDPYNPPHQLGPDYLIPTDEIRSWLPKQATKISTRDSNIDWKFESVPTLFRKTVDEFPDTIALAVKRNDGVWHKRTYAQYLKEVRTAAKGFIQLGLIPFNGVCILGFNAPEWHISHFATIFAGGLAAGIYTTNSAEACLYAFDNCSANIAVVENDVQLAKVLNIRDALSNLKAIVQYTGKPQHHEVLSWDELLEIGKSVPDEILDRRIKGLAVNQCCSLIYTSGTTGNPKGVMLTHDTMISMTKYLCTYYFEHKKGDKTVSYLPLSHVAGLGMDAYVSLYTATTVYFAPPDALKGKLLDILLEVEPTILLGVPRIYEKMYDKLRETERSMNILKRNLFQWAQKQGLKYYTSFKLNQTSSAEPYLLTVAKNLVLKKVKSAMGLHNVRHFICGGAPFSNEIHNYFLGLDIFVEDGYGLSECSGAHCINSKTNFRPGSVGNVNVCKEFEVKIDGEDKEGNGEILIRGRDVFMGYLHDEKKTLETIDEDGWLHTGDIGTIDQNGFLFITGRLKEIIITSGGENIPPLVIEENIMKLVPAMSNCILIGEKRKYLTMLITLKTEVDLDTLIPSDNLTPFAIKWCRSIGSQAWTVSEILRNKDANVALAIQSAIDTYNTKKTISHAQRIQKWKILPQDFCIPNGELGPTMKLKRHFIQEKYADVIDSMY